jgi:uncharacterized protein YceK
MRRIVLLLIVGLAIAGCTTVKPVADKSQVTLTGKLNPMGMSTFQYGTHLLNANKQIYALKSSKVDLKAYEGKEVIVKGLKVVGYPVDGGPDFIDVQEISNK